MITDRRSVSRAVQRVVGSSKMMIRASICSAPWRFPPTPFPCDRRHESVRRRSRSTSAKLGSALVDGAAVDPETLPMRFGKRSMNRFSMIERFLKTFSSWWMKAVLPLRLGVAGGRSS